MESSLIQKLDRCLLSSHPILFTGAGFSLGATNGNGEAIPSGNVLKKNILIELLGFKENSDEYNDLFTYSLADICSFASEQVSELKVHDFIVSQFIDCTPQDFHKIIATFSFWRKIYTINIDDVIENSVPNGYLIVQNTERPFSYTRAKQKEYIKLHGCVRNRSGNLVFSNQQYVDSMLHSTDYRFNSFAQDMQIENFVVVGTEMNEINLDYYLRLFSSVSSKTSHGQLFFINPRPSLIFKSKVSKIGAHILEWTTEEFANHLKSLTKTKDSYSKSHIIDDFLYVKDKYEKDKKFKGYNSYLYFGQHPDYRDIIYDWDFSNPEIKNKLSDIVSYIGSRRGCKLMVAFYGKSMTGKSTYLKRIAINLVNENVAVYDFCGKKFDTEDFRKKTRIIAEDTIALIFDNASFYYSEIKSLINNYPKEKNILVITAARTYSHNRKRYCLVSETWYEEMLIDGNTNSRDNVFAIDIAEKLDKKGLLGKLKAKSFDERVAYISSYQDVESCLFTITNGSYFQKRQLNAFFEKKNKLQQSKGIELLRQLAIFSKLDLPYIPLEIVTLMYGRDSNNILNICDDYITYYRDSNGIALRDSFLVPHLFQIKSQHYIQLLKKLLVVISPQVLDKQHTYWNEIASSLMKCRLLRSVLRLKNSDVKNLLSDIKSYYNDDYNYWLQVGLSEQYDSDYELALNHFRQAESMSPSSYIVRNAIARNFLRQANEIIDYETANKLLQEGERMMKQLIADREDFQVKAYSTHCLLFEKIRFYRRNGLVPDESTLREMYEMLNAIKSKDADGPMTKHINNVFFGFVRENNLASKLPTMNMYNLEDLKSLLSDEEINIEDVVENFEVD